MSFITLPQLSAAAVLLSALLFGSPAFGQPAAPAEAARPVALFNRLGCGACHGAPGAGGGGRAGDLLSSPVPRMQDGGAALYDFMRDAERGHPDLKRPQMGAPLAQLTQAQASDLIAELRASWDVTRSQRGRAEAGAVVAASGAPCQVTDALYIPLSGDRKSRTHVEAYELACAGGLGRVVLKTTSAERASYEIRDCIQASAPAVDGKSAPLACTLAANLDAKAQVRPYLTQAGVPCGLRQVRSLGSSADSTYVEAACDEDRGYLISIPTARDAGKGVTARSCLTLDVGGPIECKLTDRAAMLEARTAPLIRSAATGCEVRARRYALSNQGDDYYEVACASGAGFMVIADATGAYKAKVDCDNAAGIDGGCALTDTKAVLTTDNALYTRLAKAAGYDCLVSGYRLVSAGTGEQTVEMACANRPDGAIAQLAAGAARVFNCAAAETIGYRCKLTNDDAAFPQLTAAVKKAHPTSSCQVSASRFLGVTPDAGFVEVACADKQPGYVLQYAKATATPTDALYCSRLGAQLGITCGLPTNVGR